MNLSSQLGLITIAINVLAGCFIYILMPRNTFIKSFIILIGFFSLWASGQVFLTVVKIENAILVDQLTFFAGLGIAWAFFAFCYWVDPKIALISRMYLQISLILTLISIVAIFYPEGLILSTTKENYGFSFSFNRIYYMIYTFTFTCIFILGYHLLIIKFRRSVADNKFFIGTVLLASFVPVIAGTVFNLSLPFFNIFKYQTLGPSFTLFFTLIVSYLIFLRGRK